MDTRTDLVTLLEKLPQSSARDAIIARAKKGAFHDFKSQSITPKMDLVRELRELGVEAIAITLQVMHGEFDEKPQWDDEHGGTR